MAHSRRVWLIALLLLAASAALALVVGAVPGADWELIESLRLPRVLLAAGVGAGLAIAGATLQALFSNPLCEPYTLGISSGATLGAVAGSVLGLQTGYSGLALPALAGALVFMAVLGLISASGRASGAGLLLTGVMLQFFGASLVALWMGLTDAQGVQAAVFWLLGDLSRARIEGAWITLAGVLALGAWIWRDSRSLDALLLGEEDALTLGVDVARVRRRLTFLTSCLVGLCVSASGMIGFVGLVVPHFARRLIGPLHRALLPLCALGGASALILSDALARTVARPYELPAGVITGLLGAPLFVWLLLSRKEARRG